MPFEYEALVGHLYVVGGRSISTAPPGSLVEVAPLKAARGRETDTFFMLVLPSGDAIAPVAFYEQMARLSAERYFDANGSVTAALREVFNHINNNLVEYNRITKEKAYEANLVCAVLRGDDLIIGRIGSGIALLLHEDRYESVPSDLTNDEMLYIPPLGVQVNPDVKLTRHKVTSGTRLVLGDSNLADFTSAQLETALGGDDVGAVLINFKELARLQLTIVAVEFVPPETAVPLPVLEGESTVAVAEAQRAASSKARQTEQPVKPQRRTGIAKTSDQITKRTQIGLGAAARQTSSTFSLLSKTIEHYFGDPPDGKKRGLSLPVATGTAIMLPVIIVGAVVAIWLSSTGQSKFEICIEEANKVAEIARDVPSSNPGGTVSAWNTVITASRECLKERPNDETSTELIRQGQEIIDRINLIDRLDAVALVQLPGNIQRLILEGLDLYILADVEGGQRVYQALLSENGVSFASQPAPIVSMRTGATVDGFPIGSLVDIAFSDRDNAIYALDSSGVLVSCDRRLTQTCQAQRLRDAELWQSPASIMFWGTTSRLYVLDPAANQIWRYERTGGSYNDPSQEYFTGQNRANIGNAVDFGIDTGGNIYIAFSNGGLLSFNTGEVQTGFSVTDFPEGQEMNSAQSMFLNDSPLDPSIYVTDNISKTIYKVTLGGMRRNIYRVRDEDVFRTLSSVTAGGSADTIYASAADVIYALFAK